MWINIEKISKKWLDTLQLRVDVRAVPALCFRYKTYHSTQNGPLYSENKNLFWKTLSKIFKTQKNSKTTHVREVFFLVFRAWESQITLDKDESYSYCTLATPLQNEILFDPPGFEMTKCEHKLWKRPKTVTFWPNYYFCSWIAAREAF